MRYIYQNVAKDGNGHIIPSATINVYEAGGTTAANIYVASSGGSAVNSVTSDSDDGSFSFYVDEADYGSDQLFKTITSKTGYRDFPLDDILIYPPVSLTSTQTFTNKTLVTPTIVSMVNAQHSHEDGAGGGTLDHNAATDNPSSGTHGATGTIVGTTDTQTLINKTLTTPTIASLTNAQHDHTDAAGGGALTGMTVQAVHTQTGVLSTGTTSFPFDDSIPQNDEGDEVMTLAITPTNSSNKLLIEVIVLVNSSNANGGIQLGLFQDSTANALAAMTGGRAIGGNQPTQIVFRHEMTAGTTSATTFKVRIGTDSAGTTTFNGQSGARRFGGVAASSIRITEIQV